MIKDEIEVYSSYEGEDITILVRIDGYNVVKPNSRADNPDDFYGYEEMDYTVLQVTNMETGEELDIKLDKDDEALIEDAIRGQYV